MTRLWPSHIPPLKPFLANSVVCHKLQRQFLAAFSFVWSNGPLLYQTSWWTGNVFVILPSTKFFWVSIAFVVDVVVDVVPSKVMAFVLSYLSPHGRRGDLVVGAFASGLSSPGSSPGWGHCVVFLGKTLNFHIASLYPGVWMGTSEFNAGTNPAMDYHPIQGSGNTPSRFILRKPG